MINLDEAIAHYEKKAEECERDSDFYTDYVCYQMSEAERKELRECASEHRQLAEWLRELNEIKHLFSVTEKLFRANFKNGLIDVVDGYDILFSEHKQLREIFEEVKADEDSD